MTEWWICLSVDLFFDLNVSSTPAKTISFPVLCIGDAGHSNNDSSLYPRCNMVMNAKIKSSLYVSMSPIVSWKRLIQSSDYAEEALCCHIDPIFCLPTCPSRFLWISKHQQHPQIFLPAMSELGVLQPEVANRKKTVTITWRHALFWFMSKRVAPLSCPTRYSVWLSTCTNQSLWVL